MYPFIILGKLRIPTYGLCMLLGVALVACIAAFMGKKRNVSSESVIIIVAITLLMAIVGGSILYTFVTYSFSDIINYIKKGDFSFLGGGIVFYGGLFGGIVGAVLGARIAKVGIGDLEQLFVPYVPLGHAIGRVGCLLAGCCHGFSYTGPLAVSYPQSVLGLPAQNTYFPVQLLEAFLDILITVYLIYYCKKSRRKFDILFTYLLLYALMRFITETMRGDEIRGIYFFLSTSQWISVGLVLVYFIRILYIKKRFGSIRHFS